MVQSASCGTLGRSETKARRDSDMIATEGEGVITKEYQEGAEFFERLAEMSVEQAYVFFEGAHAAALAAATEKEKAVSNAKGDKSPLIQKAKDFMHRSFIMLQFKNHFYALRASQRAQ